MAKSKTQPRRSCSTLAIIAIILFALLIACVAIAFRLRSEPQIGASNEITLTVGYSAEKEQTFAQLVELFNQQKPRLSNGKRVTVVAQSYDPDKMIDAALDNLVQAVSPDSSLWLADLDRAWANRQGADVTLVGDTARYMVSPVVVAMWRDVAQSLGYPERELGWEDLLKAAEQPEFKWSHASTSTASGLLATLALFYAGAGMQRGLTEEAVTAQATLDYVARLERTVKFYGEGEAAILQQVEREGRAFLDAFVVQEQMVISYNLRRGAQLAAIYPKEGTLWVDHPLALLEHPLRNNDERLAFSQFKQFLLSPETQALVLRQGYRPADLAISLTGADSPIQAANGADPTKPYTTLQIPSSSVISVVKNAWQFTKRRANIYLIVDVSGSMYGRKLDDAKAALQTFVDQIQNDSERVGLITFSTSVSERVPLTQLGEGRARLMQTIQALEAGGNTALLDSIQLGLTKLQDLNDTERINAIVVMTDGKENQSRTNLRTLTDRLRNQRPDLPIVVFCIAYGNDADMGMLESISSASGGLTRRGELETIQQLYKTLSSYF